MPRTRCFRLCWTGFLAWLFLLAPVGATAIQRETDPKVLPISANQEVCELALWMDVFEDPTGTLELTEIEGKQFRANHSKALNFGVTHSVFWLRFRIAPLAGDSGPWEIHRILDPGEAFPGRMKWSLYDGTAGRLLAAGGTRNGHGNNVRLRILPRPETYYLRVESSTGLILRPRLFTWQAYFNHVKLRTVWFGLFYGIIIAVAVYNLFLFFSFNDHSYFWYVIHLIFVACYFLGINGFSGTYLLPGKSELLGMLNRSFLGLMTASIALLTRSFLMSRHKTPGIDRFIVALFFVALAVTAINAIVPARFINTVLILMGMLTPSVMMVASWGAMRSGFRPARIFLLAWGAFLLGVVLFALTVGGAIPFRSMGFHGFQIGSAIAAILLSLALGDRIRTLREERATFKQSMERVSMILDSIESGVFLIDSKSRKIREINLAAEKMVGRTREEIVGKPCWDFICSAGKETCPIIDFSHGDESREDRLINTAGKDIPVLKRAKLIRLDGHDLILESFVDISNLKRAEEAVRRSEAKFRSLFESSRDAVMILDQGKFVDCNQATLAMFGCETRESFIGNQPADLSPQTQPSGAGSQAQAEEYIEQALNRGSLFFEWVHQKTDGEQFPVEVMLSEVEVEGKQMLQALARDITRRKAMEEELKRLAATDPLTGADNRRSFLEKGAYELLRSRRYGHPFSLLMLDVDHFKAVNDTYGHPAGDQVLKTLVAGSGETLRDTDLLGRLGGEEFGIILPETDADKAMEAGERLRKALSETTVRTESGPIRFTVSVGVAQREEKSDTLVAIMGRADAALYRAKAEGRNRVVGP